ncbi:MAG TPA: hypothetical protein VJ750_01695 [Rhizomicrobium sp.]|nr:hypothetical protein [Rhizomicrobium sp.]
MKAWTGLALCLLTNGALAQDIEQVTVYGSTMAGFWKIERPKSIEVTFFHGVKWGPISAWLCRIEQAKAEATVHCLGGPVLQNGTATLSDGKIHLAWGFMVARLVVDGIFETPKHYTGTFAVKLAGISHENPAPVGGTKIVPSPQAPDPDGKAALLRTILTEGLSGVPFDANAIKKNAGSLADTLKAVLPGPVLQVTWIGREPRYNKGGKELNAISVYAVEFEGGERICGLHQRGDGTLDAFQCV